MQRLLNKAAQRIDIGDNKVVRLRQHFFEEPVAQPRLGRRIADRSGLKLWPAALPLLEHLRVQVLPHVRRVLGRHPRVLELGSGCGLLGIGLAAAGCGRVVLTDPGLETTFVAGEGEASTLDWLRANLDLNQEVTRSTCSVERLVWGDADHFEAIRRAHPDGFDLVVGSDLMYESAHYAALLATLDEFAPKRPDHPGAVLGYAHRVKGERRFVDMAAAHFVADTQPLAGTRHGASVTAMSRNTPAGR